MDPLQWIADMFQALGIKLVELSATASGITKDSWNWLLEPQRRVPRIFLILKCLVYLLTGIALTLYIGWKGLELAQATLKISRQANELAAKQICNGEVSTASRSRYLAATNQSIRI